MLIVTVCDSVKPFRRVKVFFGFFFFFRMRQKVIILISGSTTESSEPHFTLLTFTTSPIDESEAE